MLHKKIVRLSLSALLLSGAFVFVATPEAEAQNSQNFNKDIYEDSDAPPPAPAPQPPQAAGLQATDLQMRMNTLENLVRGLTGQVEKLQFQNNQLAQSLQKMASDNELRFRDVEQKVSAQDAGMRGLVAAQQTLAQQQAAAAPPPATTETKPAAEKPAAPAPEKATEKPAEKSEGLDAPQAKDKSTGGGTLGTITQSKDEKKDEPAAKGDDATAQSQYDEAFTSLRQAKYDDAEKSFTTFLKNHPKHRLAENAKYWLAETFYVRGKFQEAAVAFAEAYQEFPKGTKAPDNLLKLSMSLGSIGKKPDACLTLSELAKKFPQATAITKNRAEQQKKTLGCT